MAGHGEKWTRKQDQAIAALLVHPTIPAAAKAVGVGETTLWRWLQREDFQDAYRAAKREAVAQAIAQLQRASGEAVKALSDVMNGPITPAGARVSAAKTILEMAVKGIELEDLAARVEELEKVAEQARGAGAAWR